MQKISGVSGVQLPEPSKKETPQLEPTQDLVGLIEDSGIRYGTAPQHNRFAMRKGGWNPKELSPFMQRIMDIQLMNPSLKAKEIARLVGVSKSTVSRVISCDMYRMRYKQRRLEIEKILDETTAREVKKFRELRDKMIELHKELIEKDPAQYAGKELEYEKLRQRSISEILRLSAEELRHLQGKIDNNGNGQGKESSVETGVELDLSDPNAAYLRVVSRFRKGTK